MQEFFKSTGAIIKDNGTMADLSKKITVFLNELDDTQVINLNKLVKSRSVDIIILPKDMLSSVENVINAALSLEEDIPVLDETEDE